MEKIALIGGTEAFYDFLRKAGGAVQRMEEPGQALRDPKVTGLILLPDYDGGMEITPQLSLVDTEILAERKRSGFRVYVENYDAFNYYQCSIFGYETMGGLCHIANESLCAQQGLQYEMGGERILQASGAACLPAAASFRDPFVSEQFVLLTKGYFVGTSQIAFKADKTQPMLLRSGSVISALFSMTKFDSVSMRPNCRWKKVFASVFSRVLGVDAADVETAFEACYPPIRTRMKVQDHIAPENWQKAVEQALYDAVQWHFDSGVILGDGSKGAVEMILSSNQALRMNRRVDAGLYTGWLTYAAGRYFRKEAWQKAGMNVFTYFLERCQLKSGDQEGMFEWYYDQFAGPLCIYSIDSGRCGIALCNMYRLTGKEEYKDRIVRLADGFLRWMDGDLLRGAMQRYNDPLTGKPTNVVQEKTVSCTPDIYAEMGAFLCMAARIAGKAEYAQTAARIAARLIKAYPDKFEFYGHTTSARNARFLMLLASVHLAGAADYTDMINHLVDYIGSLQLPCGGIYSEDNMNFERQSGFAPNGENGITTPWDNDRISDQLYCVNNAIAALSLVCTLRDGGIHREKARGILKGLMEYIVKIQITAPDKRLHGGWMRAFSMTLGEYYGLDMDLYWGPYCIMAGWTMGILPLSLLAELEGTCPYSLD